MKTALLIVDDEPNLIEILKADLEDLDVPFLTALNGEAALEIVRHPPKGTAIVAILSDINMPQMNGMEFLREVRKMELDTPFVFLTAYGDKERVIEALKLGAFDFVEKPYDSSNLFRTIRTAVELGKMLRTTEMPIDLNEIDDPDGRFRLRNAMRAISVMRQTARQQRKRRAQ